MREVNIIGDNHSVFIPCLERADGESRVAILAPRWCSKFLSYCTGWTTLIAWQAALSSTAYFGGTMIQGLLILNYKDYVFERWHGTLLFYAIIALSVFINTYLARLLPQFEMNVLMVHILGFFTVLIPLVYLTPTGSASDVFATFVNTGWSPQGLSFFIGLSASQLAFVDTLSNAITGFLELIEIGVDAASHMG